ncbi:MAG: hypothetical protein K8R21_07165, partial [Leptospira sp.]|nr:hypothetical protein [Leptospira sp.]
LKVAGHAQFENDGKTFAIRVDEIKFGILPITNTVLSEMQARIKDPKVKIDPPWIRITVGK